MTPYQSEALDKRQLIKQFIFDYNMNTSAGGMDETKAIEQTIDSIMYIFKDSESALLNRIEETIPEKKDPKLAPLSTNPQASAGYIKGYNKALEEVKQILQQEREKL